MRYFRTLAISVATLLLGSIAAAWAATPSPFGVDLAGRRVESLAPPGTRAVVLLFVATDCPISSRYLPELQQMERSLRGQPVRFFTVYPNPGETAAGVRAQQAAFGAGLPALLDPEQSLVRLAGARVTPEAAVLIPEGNRLREVYLGRIDDRYLDLGHQRPQATRKELELALRALLAGGPVEPPKGRAVGCSIVPLP